LGFAIAPRVILHQLKIAENPGEKIIEVMRYICGKPLKLACLGRLWR
jgi:hypothetical protein